MSDAKATRVREDVTQADRDWLDEDTWASIPAYMHKHIIACAARRRTSTASPDAGGGDVALHVPRHWPELLTPELHHILGMMCFQLGAPAHIYQAIGEFTACDGLELGKRAEDEQAFMLHKLLGFWFEHGSAWGTHAVADLRRAKAAVAATTDADRDSA